MSSLSTLPKGDSAWLLRKAIERIIDQVSVLETNIGSSTTGNSSNTQVIFNDNGTLRGDPDLIFNTTLNRLVATNLESTASLLVGTSATITGDLTVKTNVLKVDSANNRVGIRTASPAEPLTVDNSSGVTTGAIRIYATDQAHSRIAIQNGNGQAYHLVAGNPGASNAGFALYDNTGAATRWYVDNTGVHSWQNVGGVAGTAMTLNSTGLGVGASPSTRLHISNTGDVYARIATTSVSKAGVQLSANGVVRSHLLYDDGAGTTYLSSGTGFGGSGQALVLQSGTSLQIYTNNQLATANMTLDASGNLLVGTTSNSPAGTQSQFVNQWSGGAKWGSTFNQTVSSAIPYTHIAFCTNGAVRGSIDANNTTITYGTVSDYRLKENVQPISNALTRIADLKPSTYKWKDSGTDGEGFIAHELASVVPLAVIGQKDALNEDGTIKAQQIDLSKVVPVLVAAIQELTARVQTLEAR